MNKISVEKRQSFQKEILSLKIDGHAIGQLLYHVTNQKIYKDLWSAWLLNDEDNYSRYIWSLLDGERACNLPILLCPDDMDFWCTIIVAQVTFSDETVAWNKLGTVTGKIDSIKWCESGIKNLASWSETDWEKYGATLPFLENWEQWWSENWIDEENRRIWNYFDPYLNQDQNITWFDCPVFTFKLEEYQTCVAKFKSYQY